MKKRYTIPILVSSADDRYAMPLAVMLKSAMLNLRDSTGLQVYILDGGISRHHKRKILSSVSGTRLKLEWILPDRHSVEGLPVFGHVNISTYYRLLIPDLLPKSVGRAIYLDADCLVLGNLNELWVLDMEGNPLLAVPERGMTAASCPLPQYRELGIPPDSKCLNGGMLVMELHQWRQSSISVKIFEYLRKNQAEIRFWDQDGLNAILAGKWGELSPKWNFRADNHDSVEELKKLAKIIHFASSIKPWHYYYDQPARSLFYEYLNLTQWNGWRPHPPLRVLLNKHYWGGHLRASKLFRGLWHFRKKRIIEKAPASRS